MLSNGAAGIAPETEVEKQLLFGSNVRGDKVIPGTEIRAIELSNFHENWFALQLPSIGINSRFSCVEAGFQQVFCKDDIYSSKEIFESDDLCKTFLAENFGESRKTLGKGRRKGKLAPGDTLVKDSSGIKKRRANFQLKGLAAKLISNPKRLDHLGMRRRFNDDLGCVNLGVIMAGVQAAMVRESPERQKRLLATGDLELVEMCNRGKGNRWTGGPGGSNLNGKCNMLVRDTIANAQDVNSALAALTQRADDVLRVLVATNA